MPHEGKRGYKPVTHSIYVIYTLYRYCALCDPSLLSQKSECVSSSIPLLCLWCLSFLTLHSGFISKYDQLYLYNILGV